MKLFSVYNRGLSIMTWPSNKQSTIFINSLPCFEFLRDWILSRKDDSRVWVLALLCSACSMWRLNFFLLNRFLETLGTFSTYLLCKFCSTALVNWVKTGPDSSIMESKSLCFQCAQAIYCLINLRQNFFFSSIPLTKDEMVTNKKIIDTVLQSQLKL